MGNEASGGIRDVVPETVINALSKDKNATHETDLWQAWQIFLSQTTKGTPALLKAACDLFQIPDLMLRGILNEVPQIVAWPAHITIKLTLNVVTPQSIGTFFKMYSRDPKQCAAILQVKEKAVWFELYRPARKCMSIDEYVEDAIFEAYDIVEKSLNAPSITLAGAINEALAKFNEIIQFKNQGFVLRASDTPLPFIKLLADGHAADEEVHEYDKFTKENRQVVAPWKGKVDVPSWVGDSDTFQISTPFFNSRTTVTMERISIMWLQHMLNKTYEPNTNNDVDRYVLVALGIRKSNYAHRNYLIFDRLNKTVQRIEPHSFDIRNATGLWQDAAVLLMLQGIVNIDDDPQKGYNFKSQAHMFDKLPSEAKKEICAVKETHQVLGRYDPREFELATDSWSDVVDFAKQNRDYVTSSSFVFNSIVLNLESRSYVKLSNDHFEQFNLYGNQPSVAALVEELIRHENKVLRVRAKEIEGGLETTKSIFEKKENDDDFLFELNEFWKGVEPDQYVLILPIHGLLSDFHADWKDDVLRIINESSSDGVTKFSYISKEWVKEQTNLESKPWKPNPWIETMTQLEVLSVEDAYEVEKSLIVETCERDHPEVSLPLEIIQPIYGVQFDDMLCTIWSIYLGLLVALNPEVPTHQILNYIHDYDGSLRRRMFKPLQAVVTIILSETDWKKEERDVVDKERQQSPFLFSMTFYVETTGFIVTNKLLMQELQNAATNNHRYALLIDGQDQDIELQCNRYSMHQIIPTESDLYETKRYQEKWYVSFEFSSNVKFTIPHAAQQLTISKKSYAEPKERMYRSGDDNLRVSYRRLLLFVFICLLNLNLESGDSVAPDIPLHIDALFEARMRLQHNLPLVSQGLLCMGLQGWNYSARSIIQHGYLSKPLDEYIADAVTPENSAADVTASPRMDLFLKMQLCVGERKIEAAWQKRQNQRAQDKVAHLFAELPLNGGIDRRSKADDMSLTLTRWNAASPTARSKQLLQILQNEGANVAARCCALLQDKMAPYG